MTAHEYYVDSVNGNNANAGTSWGAAKATLNGAEDIPVVAGDRVHCRGLFRETLTVDVSGGNSYSTGTISVTKGSKTVTGSGTSFTGNAFADGQLSVAVLASGTDGVTNGTSTFTSAAGNFQAGHVGLVIRIGTKGAYVITAVGSTTSITLSGTPSSGTGLTYNVGPTPPIEIASVDSNTQITLKYPWWFPSFTGLSYETWRDIQYVVDPGDEARITGSDNDQTATRSNAATASGKSYRTFRGFRIDRMSGDGFAVTNTSPGWIIEDCEFHETSSAAVYLASAASVKWTFRRNFALTNNVVFSFPAQADNTALVLENNIVRNRAEACFYLAGTGGALVRNNTIQGLTGVYEWGVNSGQAIQVIQNIFMLCATACAGAASGNINEDYNAFVNNNSDRSNTATGSNSVAHGPLLAAPVRAYGFMFPQPPRGSLSQWSTLAAKASPFPPYDDFYGVPRPTTGSKNSWGAVQYPPVSRSTTQKHGGTYSLNLSDAGRTQFFVPVTATPTTISVYVYREADYAGTNPQMIIRELGVAERVTTDAGSSGGWNQLTDTFTPSAAGVVAVEIVSDNTATSGSYAVYVDDLAVA